MAAQLSGVQGGLSLESPPWGEAVETAEVGDHDTAGGAVFGADAKVGAVLTLFIVDYRNIVDHTDGAFRTDAFAFFAADTAVGADLAGYGTLILIAAGNNYPFYIRNQ